MEICGGDAEQMDKKRKDLKCEAPLMEQTGEMAGKITKFVSCLSCQLQTADAACF